MKRNRTTRRADDEADPMIPEVAEGKGSSRSRTPPGKRRHEEPGDSNMGAGSGAGGKDDDGSDSDYSTTDPGEYRNPLSEDEELPAEGMAKLEAERAAAIGAYNKAEDKSGHPVRVILMRGVHHLKSYFSKDQRRKIRADLRTDRASQVGQLTQSMATKRRTEAKLKKPAAPTPKPGDFTTGADDDTSRAGYTGLALGGAGGDVSQMGGASGQSTSSMSSAAKLAKPDLMAAVLTQARMEADAETLHYLAGLKESPDAHEKGPGGTRPPGSRNRVKYDNQFYRFLQAYVQSYGNLFNDGTVMSDFGAETTDNPMVSTTSKIERAMLYAAGVTIDKDIRFMPQYDDKGKAKKPFLGHVEFYAVDPAWLRGRGHTIVALVQDNKIRIDGRKQQEVETAVESSIPGEYHIERIVMRLPNFDGPHNESIESQFGLNKRAYEKYRAELIATSGDRVAQMEVVDNLVREVAPHYARHITGKLMAACAGRGEGMMVAYPGRGDTLGTEPLLPMTRREMAAAERKAKRAAKKAGDGAGAGPTPPTMTLPGMLVTGATSGTTDADTVHHADDAAGMPKHKDAGMGGGTTMDDDTGQRADTADYESGSGLGM